ncbi:hypothetical protein [Streptomyces orinoci]|uniref:Secreted protein n=1 Tax=Streptomyces orinoci TaxID=67339 RepID=A0ABV3K4Z3_STRON|nr:hypothetical protein [Streptomyces orinoci]
MNHKYLKTAAVTALVAVAFGVATPAATAVEAKRTASAANAAADAAAAAETAISEADFQALKAAGSLSEENGEASLSQAELSEMYAIADAQAAADAATPSAGDEPGAAAGRAKAVQKIISLLKRSPGMYKSAVKAAKKGGSSFRHWVNSLSDWNPVKWAIKGAPEYIFWELVRYLSGM